MKGIGYFVVAAFAFLCAIAFWPTHWPLSLLFAVVAAVIFALGLPIGEPKPNSPRHAEPDTRNPAEKHR